MSTNIKEQRQLLAQKKEARVLKMMELGEKAYKKLLVNNLQEVGLLDYSTEVLNIDKEIYNLTKAINEQEANAQKCTQCQSPVDVNVKFCGQCGQLNAFYVDESIAMKACSVCEEQINANLQYCPCCGTEQGGY